MYAWLSALCWTVISAAQHLSGENTLSLQHGCNAEGDGPPNSVSSLLPILFYLHAAWH